MIDIKSKIAGSDLLDGKLHITFEVEGTLVFTDIPQPIMEQFIKTPNNLKTAFFVQNIKDKYFAMQLG